jgi:alanyl-tRNA synthetase
MRWTTHRIRQSFLDFFRDHGHKIVPSASLIPKGDPTLLFVNAGMVPFKDYFLGVRTAADKRVADCQKCLRISGKHNDLEAVGRDGYHHTFFEMMGNWSFGDYYKREAIQFHWELITKVWEIPRERLWATVYRDDDEAEKAWRDLKYLPPERILRFGEKDNFWEMGETGPCGPCSEIHIDRGPEASRHCTHPDVSCAVNVDGCSRFIELANLVFIQYDRDSSGRLTPLPMKHVDTGTGLERVAAVLQSIESNRLLSNYDIDVFAQIIGSIQQAVDALGVKRPYGQAPESDISYRAIADHSRAITFLAAEGLQPGKNGPEYVLRRLIRRAVWHGYLLGIGTNFLANICSSVVKSMGDAYPELREREEFIRKSVDAEESQFGDIVRTGIDRINQWAAQFVAKSGKLPERLPGDFAFELHDTYGLPIDLTIAACREKHGLEVDLDGFDRLMTEQRERARSARREEAIAPELMVHGAAASRFVGYRDFELQSHVIASREEGDTIVLVTAETPFYPEGGGQVGDRGVIEVESGGIVEIVDTRKSGDMIVHIGRLLRGNFTEFTSGKKVNLRVDRERRVAAMLNHSATHILHYALRELLGKNVHQAGSLVAPGRLRFDFTQSGPVGAQRLEAIEEEVNARIRENAPVAVEEMQYDDAIKSGALAFFGDKYGDRVRVVRMGDFSIELCGGTHVSRTGDVGLFKLTGESAVAAGVRRIEAMTGETALELIRKREQLLERIAGQLGSRDEAALERLEKILAREKELEKKLRALELKLVAGASDGDGERIVERNGLKIVTRRVAGIDAKALREMADRMRGKHGSAVVAIGSDLGEDRVALVVAVTPDLSGRVKAGEIIRKIAPIVGGSGGGRPDFAQAGGRQPAKLDAALAAVAEAIA